MNRIKHECIRSNVGPRLIMNPSVLIAREEKEVSEHAPRQREKEKKMAVFLKHIIPF